LMVQRLGYHRVTDVQKRLKRKVNANYINIRYRSHASKGTFCRHEIASAPGVQPVAARTRANGLPGLSNVLASGEFLLPRLSKVMRTYNTRREAYKGPVDESAIPARNRDCVAGNRKWLSTLPAPAD
jgi:hypothetical protein